MQMELEGDSRLKEDGQLVFISAWGTTLTIPFLLCASSLLLAAVPLSAPLRGDGSTLARSHTIFLAMKHIFRKLGLFLVAQH